MENFQRITFNLKPVTRHDQMEGREFLVAPMVMILEGVHAGSNGPLLYTNEDITKFAPAWDHKPVVVYHPEKNGVPISACDPVILSSRKIGVIMNTKAEDGKLKAEAWLEEDRVKAVDERVLDAIQNGEMMELSTGLYADHEEVEGEWKGEKYQAIARNYRPDHLAILPDKVGACSVADGAGFLRVNEKAKELGIPVAQLNWILNKACSAVQNQLSDSDIRDQLRALLVKKVGKDENVFIEAVFKDTAVYEVFPGGNLFRVKFKKKKDLVTVEGIPEAVVRKVEFKPKVVANSGKEKSMEKEKVVNDLIENGQFEEDDREWLMGLDESKLTKMAPKKEEPKPKHNQNAQGGTTPPPAPANPPKELNVQTPAPQTAGEYIANAPVEMQPVLHAAMASYQKERQGLVTRILSNQRNSFTQEELDRMPNEQLEKIAAMAHTPAPQTVNYGGQLSPAPATAPVTNEEPLALPALDFSK